MSRITGAKRSQIEHWSRSQIIVPEVVSAGTGNKRGFSFRNLVEFAIGAELTRYNFQISDLFKALTFLRIADDDDWNSNNPAELKDFAEIHRKRRAWLAALPLDERAAEHARQEAVYARTEALTGFNRSKREMLRRTQRDLDRLGIKRDAADYLEELDRAELARWRAFKNPTTRTQSTYYIVKSGDLWGLEHSQELASKMDAHPSVFALNLRLLLEKLEAATGDYWRGWSELYPGEDHEALRNAARGI